MKKKIILSVTILLIILFTYHNRLFDSIISIDTEIFLLNKKEMINSWFAIDRFGLGILKFLLSWIPFKIEFINILSLIIFSIAIIIYAKDITKKMKNNNFLNISIILLFIITSPLFAEQYVFTLQALEISIGYLLIVINFKLINKFIYDNNKKWLFIVIPLLSFIFGIYQAFCLLFISLSIIYFIINNENNNFDKKQILKIMFKYLFILLSSIILYILLPNLIKDLLNIDSSTYLNNQIGWTKNIFKSILYIGYYFLNVLLSLKIYYNPSYLFACILSIIYIIKNKNRFNSLIIFTLLLTPFTMSILFGNITIARSQFALPFVTSFIFIYTLKNNKKIYYLIPTFFIVWQIFTTNLLFENDKIRYEKDVKLTKEIAENINYKKGQTIIFIGNSTNDSKYTGDTLGRTFYNWDSETEIGANGRIIGLSKNLGFGYNMATIEQIKFAKENIDLFSGKINYYENTIVINLEKW